MKQANKQRKQEQLKHTYIKINRIYENAGQIWTRKDFH